MRRRRITLVLFLSKLGSSALSRDGGMRTVFDTLRCPLVDATPERSIRDCCELLALPSSCIDLMLDLSRRDAWWKYELRTRLVPRPRMILAHHSAELPHVNATPQISAAMDALRGAVDIVPIELGDLALRGPGAAYSTRYGTGQLTGICHSPACSLQCSAG